VNEMSTLGRTSVLLLYLLFYKRKTYNMQSEHTNLDFSMLRTFFISCFLLIACLCHADPITYPSNQQTHDEINAIFQQLQLLPTQNISDRIAFISKQFLGRPYYLGALGEGEQALFDQAPLYRTDAFDCETFVDTVLALAFANNLASFEYYIKQIRYHHGHVEFIDRNHFTCLDWNKNNQKQGFLRDITRSIHDENNRSVAMTANALIDKPGWYRHFSSTNIRLRHATPQEEAERLALLKQKGQQLPITNSSIAYVPLTAIFNPEKSAANQVNDDILKQIPNGAIIEIIRPNWDLTKEIGTHLNVSHLGLAVWEKGTLYFIQASSAQHRVVQGSLVDYLRNAQASPTIKGINIQVANQLP